MESKLLSAEEIKNFQVRRGVINLYKSFLVMLEDLEEEHIHHFDKLYQTFKDDVSVIRQADYFTEERMSYLRKKILDAGNDCIRNLTGDNGNDKG